MTKNKLFFAYLSVILNAIIVGFSFLFVKIALQVTDPIDTLAFRFLISFLAMTLPVSLGWIKIQYKGKRIWRLLPIALLYPTLFFTFQTFGLAHAASSEAGILFAFGPITTMILATIFLKERTTLKQKLFISLSVFGVVFIFWMNGANLDLSHSLGIFLLFLSVLTVGGYSVMARFLSKEFTPMELTYIMMGFGLIFFNLAALIKHGWNGSLLIFFVPLGNIHFLFAILYLSVLSSLLTSLLSNYSLSIIEASKVSVFSNLSTILSILAGVWFLDETIYWYHWFGSLLIITGVLGTNFIEKTKPKPQTDNN